MQETCKLCKTKGKLQKSHITPKFVGKWLKNNGSGYLREISKPDKRVQDTSKKPLLCGNCEILFSKWEKKFADKVFYPFIDKGESIANYDDWMSKFCASLSWRTLVHTRSKPKRPIPQEVNNILDQAEDHLAKFLLGKVSNLNQYEQHVLPFIHTITVLPTNINKYFCRTTHQDIIITPNGNLYLYTKLPDFIILCTVKAKEPKQDFRSKMRASRIALKSGKLSPKKYYIPIEICNYVSGNVEELNNL